MAQPRTHYNLIANFFGSGWSAVMGLAFIPFYINLMGVEAYGLVGVYISLQAIFSILDLGLSQTLGREMSRLSLSSVGHQQMANTARTLEIIYWASAVLLGSMFALSSHFIAKFWLNPVQLSSDSVSNSLLIMALVIALRWPLTLYIGGLNGLQRQVSLNVQLAFFATFQGVGAILVLWLIKPTIEAFFLWQGISSLLQVLSIRLGFWRAMPLKVGHFSLSVLYSIWRFALSMTGISLLAAILTQLDKLVLSKMLSLENFGFYVFASSVASILFRVVSPIFTTYLPRFTQLLTVEDMCSLKNSYHTASQIMAIALVPVACVLSLYAHEVLMLWTQNEQLAEHTYLLVAVLTLGNMLNGLVTVPYALQVAHGWTRFALIQNLLAVVLMVPALFIFVNQYGEVGAAFVWAGLNLLFLLVGVFIMHRKLLSGQWGRWLLEAVICPLFVGSLTVLLFKGLRPAPDKTLLTIVFLSVVSIVVFCSVAASLPVGRQLILRMKTRLA